MSKIDEKNQIKYPFHKNSHLIFFLYIKLFAFLLILDYEKLKEFINLGF